MFYPIYSTQSITKAPLNILYLGLSHQQEPVYRPEGNNYFQWFYCVQGRGELILHGQRTIISEGMGFFFYPNEPFACRSLEEDWLLHSISFDGSLCIPLLSDLQITTSGAFNISDSSLFLEYIEQMLKIHDNNTIDREIELSTCFYNFLLKISHCITQTKTLSAPLDNTIIHKVLDYLEKNYNKTISLDDMAELVHLSKNHLCVLFKKTTNETLINYLLKLRIGHAKVLLMQYPDKTAAEIGKKCGFQNPSYFGEIFKKEVGITPNLYRKKPQN